MKTTVDYDKLVGIKFGRLTVKHITGKRSDRHEMFIDCVCDCGNSYTTVYPRLKSGNTKSCGCLQPVVAAQAGKYTTKHGDSTSPTYKAHRAMMRRCYDKGSISYPSYGGKGITVCDRWRGVENYTNFKLDMGERPDGMTLDRFPDPNGNYEPGNCRWATPKEQSRNLSSNHWITVNGETLLLIDWASRLGVTATTILDRLEKGWSKEKAVTTQSSPRNIAKLIEVGGETLTLKEAAVKYNIPWGCLRSRLAAGKTPNEAVLPSKGSGRRGKRIVVSGESMSYTECSAKFGIPYHTLLERLNRGWSPDDAISVPLQAGHNRPSESVADNLIQL